MLNSVVGRVLCFAGTVVLFPSLAQAQPSAQQMEQITILGSAQESTVFTNPASVTVIDRHELDNQPAASVASFLRGVPGVQIMEEGVERISIRGEDSRRVAILIDGQKLTDHTNYGQPLLIDPASIERIEVLRGSSSVVSGSRAIGGVINIITRKGGDKSIQGEVRAGYFSATSGYRVSANLRGAQGGFDYRFSASRSDQGDRRTPIGRLKPSNTDDKSFSAHLGYQFDKHYLAVKAQRFDVAANVYVGEEDDFLIALPKRQLDKVGVFYQGDNLSKHLRKIKLDAYHQTIDRTFNNDVTVSPTPMMRMTVNSGSVDQQRTQGVNALAELDLIAGHDTVVGFEYEHDGIKTDKTTLTTTRMSLPMSPPTTSTSTSTSFEDATIKTTSVFLQHTAPISERLKASVGARHYRVNAKHKTSIRNGVAQPVSSNNDHKSVGAASLVWQAQDNLVLRANVSQGYLYPTLGQMFMNTTAGGAGTTYGNPNLRAETSTTYELGSRYQDQGWLLDATVFYTRAKHYIASVNTGSRSSTYQNVDQANSFGAELLAEYNIEQTGFTPYASLSVLRREIVTPTYSTYDSGNPSVFGRVGVKHALAWNRWDIENNAYVALANKATNTLGSTTTYDAGYATVNLRSSWQHAAGGFFGVELNNLTNKAYKPANEQLWGAQRSINVFAGYRF